jgi:hypothetical protein
VVQQAFLSLTLTFTQAIDTYLNYESLRELSILDRKQQPVLLLQADGGFCPMGPNRALTSKPTPVGDSLALTPTVIRLTLFNAHT